MWNSCMFLYEIIQHSKGKNNKGIVFENASDFDVCYIESNFFPMRVSSIL